MRAGPQADQFGAFVVSKFRDNALEFFDDLARSHWKSTRTQPLQAALAAMSPEQREVVRQCVRAVVDAGLHDFLFALTEAHDLGQGLVVSVDGHNIAEQSDGLHGELFGNNGWLARHSKYRGFADPV